MGLALVERITTLHGGTVSVESEVGRGSCFTVRLPYSSKDEVAPMPTTTSFPHCYLPLDNTEVLIIEDSISTADQLARYVREYGMQTSHYRYGDGALEEVLSLQPALIILDIQLPNLSGWTVLSQLKAHPQTRRIPVIIVSVVDERSRAQAMGASEYLVKPVSRTEFHATLTKLQCPIADHLTAETTVIEPPVLKSPLILLAEDNQANRETISGYLQNRGYRLILADNGQQAVELAKTQRPDLILMDIQMPGMDGLEAMGRIRAEGNPCPMIALTALAMRGDREKCLEAGANDYLTKPIKLKQLVATIDKLVSQNEDSRKCFGS